MQQTTHEQTGAKLDEPEREAPRIDAVSLDVSRITLDCIRPGCVTGEVEVRFFDPASEYTFRTTCPHCTTPYTAEEEAIALAEAKGAFENYVETYDPTPWCSGCGSKTRSGCDCGPLAEND